ncbi:hypothetical protein AB0873_18325 [Micromonospora sp. NPDC047707]|uniref:hypothetical protein n=1 Tax=Micromonospora sp. NPDC047707 TaxID=3154498 RepID=UPI003454A97B
MYAFNVSLTLWVTPTGDMALPVFVTRLQRELLRLQGSGGVGTPLVTGDIGTYTCEVTVNVQAMDVTTAPIVAGRTIAFAADNAAPNCRIDIVRVAVQSAEAPSNIHADSPPAS